MSDCSLAEKPRSKPTIALSILIVFVGAGLLLAYNPTKDENGTGLDGKDTILNVPFVHQGEWLCSEASASMVLEYYGYNLSQDQINMMGYDRFENMLPLLSRHVPCRYAPLTLKDLMKEIDGGDPVIIRVLLGRFLHTVVVIGYDERYIYIHDPGVGPNLAVRPENLLSVWRPTNYASIIFIQGTDDSPDSQG